MLTVLNYRYDAQNYILRGGSNEILLFFAEIVNCDGIYDVQN